MSKRIGINGFGRIGRLVLRAMIESGRSDIECVLINDPGSVEDDLLRCQDELSHAALTGDADRLPVLAEVLPVRPAGGAVVAGDVGLDRDAVADLHASRSGPHRFDYPRELVAGDDRIVAEVLAAVDVHVGAADPARHDPHEDLARLRVRGRGAAVEAYLTRSFDDYRLHVHSPFALW